MKMNNLLRETKKGSVFGYAVLVVVLLVIAGLFIINPFNHPDQLSLYGQPSLSNSFEVTPSGFTGTLGFTFIILLVCGALILLGFSIKDGWFVIFGGMGLIAFGIYCFINGIAGFKDTLVTQGTSLFFIGVGAYLAINSALEMMQE